MPITEHINRIQSDPDALDFAALRKDAITLVQDLCGDHWTDYNLHDPGVTILEQLCFALTDLSYRSGFPVQDYLTGDQTRIDYEKLGLYPPHEILPSSAVTSADYEKMMYDAVPEIDQIRFVSDTFGHHGISSLYTVYAKLDPTLFQAYTAPEPDAEALTKVTARINLLLENIDRLRGIMDRIAENLQIRRRALKRWLGRILKSGQQQSEQAALIQSTLEKSGMYLQQLENQLGGLSGLVHEFRAIPDLMKRQGYDAVEISQFSRMLEEKRPFFHRSAAIRGFEQVATILDAPLQEIDELVPSLDRSLPVLNVSIKRTDHFITNSAIDLDTARKRLSSFKVDSIKRKILSVFSSHRSLCEDIHSIHIIETVPYFLAGEIEVDPLHNPAKVCAEIFFKCSRHISSNVQIDHYATVLSASRDYAQIFSGPLTQHGYIRETALETPRSNVTVMALTSLIRQIDGVRQILNLNIVDAYGKSYESLDYQLQKNRFPDLQMSQAENRMHTLHLMPPFNPEENDITGNGEAETAENSLHVFFADEFQYELKKLVFEYHAYRNHKQPFEQFIVLPNGQQRYINDYYSIQNHFPAIYGINRQGVPGSMPAEVHAKAKQLKAYLYPFEQLMANYLQGLQAIPDLFAVYSEAKKTYFSQYLDNMKIPAIEPLYAESDVSPSSAIDDVSGQYDHFSERKNRILDILLALYGEKIEQQKLFRFNHYRLADAQDWIIEIKAGYLKTIREISRNRGAGFDYLRPRAQPQGADHEANRSGLQVKIGYLLGLNIAHKPPRITDVLIQRKSNLVTDQALAGKIQFLPGKTPSEAVPNIPGFTASPSAVRIVPSRLPVFSDTIFREGIRLENYRLVRAGRNATQVCFKSEHDARLWVLSKETTFHRAAVYAHQFHSTLNELNKACENFHIVEHILLRPRDAKAWDNEKTDNTFYHHRVSFIFPSWTACFSDSVFRQFAEETVQQNLPAHVFADFFWLDFEPMRDFEHRHESWLDCLRQLNQGCDAALSPHLDQAAEGVRSFLIQHRREDTRDYWF